MQKYVARPGPEDKKLDLILKLKMKRNDWTHVPKQPIIALYFEFQTVLKFYNLGAWFQIHDPTRAVNKMHITTLTQY